MLQHADPSDGTFFDLPMMRYGPPYDCGDGAKNEERDYGRRVGRCVFADAEPHGYWLFLQPATHDRHEAETKDPDKKCAAEGLHEMTMAPLVNRNGDEDRDEENLPRDVAELRANRPREALHDPIFVTCASQPAADLAAAA